MNRYLTTLRIDVWIFVALLGVSLFGMVEKTHAANDEPPPLPTCVYENKDYKVWASGIGYKTGNDDFDIKVTNKKTRITHLFKVMYGTLNSIEVIGSVVCLHARMVGNFTYAGPIVYVADFSKAKPNFIRMQYEPKWRSLNKQWFIFRDPFQMHFNHFSKFFFELWTMDRKGFRINTVKNAGEYTNFDILGNVHWASDSRSVSFEAAEYHFGIAGSEPYYSPTYNAVVTMPDDNPEHLKLTLKIKDRRKHKTGW